MEVLDDTINIILVDDHQLMLDGLNKLISGFENTRILATATNGQEALEFITHCQEEIHLVITDISMPLMDGTELCQNLKNSNSQTGVLIMSMYSSIAMVRKAIAADADGFILKNAGEEELKLAIHRIIGGGTYFSQEIIPIIYSRYQKEKRLDNIIQLTKREKEILALILKEHTSEEISRKLFISKKTVDNHRQNLLKKTSCKSTIGLVKFAIENEMFPE